MSFLKIPSTIDPFAGDDGALLTKCTCNHSSMLPRRTCIDFFCCHSCPRDLGNHFDCFPSCRVSLATWKGIIPVRPDLLLQNCLNCSDVAWSCEQTWLATVLVPQTKVTFVVAPKVAKTCPRIPHWFVLERGSWACLSHIKLRDFTTYITCWHTHTGGACCECSNSTCSSGTFTRARSLIEIACSIEGRVCKDAHGDPCMCAVRVAGLTVRPHVPMYIRIKGVFTHFV
jgi:hypothetical protein